MVKILLVNEVNNLRRDPLLLLLSLMLIMIPLLFLGGLIPLYEGVMDAGFPSELITFVLVLEMMLLGLVQGLRMIDEMDEKSILALLMTPLSQKGYFAYKGISMLVQGVVFSLYGLLVLFPAQWYLSFFISLTAPFTAFLLTAFGQNKIEAMALGKLAGLIIMLPLLRLVMTTWWTSLLWALPLTSYLQFLSTDKEIYLLSYVLISLLYTWFFFKRTQKRIY